MTGSEESVEWFFTTTSTADPSINVFVSRPSEEELKFQKKMSSKMRIINGMFVARDDSKLQVVGVVKDTYSSAKERIRDYMEDAFPDAEIDII
jgi:hypothetical protein